MMLFLLAAPDAAAQSLNPLQKLLGGGGMLTPMLLIFGVFYFLMIRPQQQKAREHEAWQKKLAVGDEVVTTGGLVGNITSMKDDVIYVEVGDKVRVRVLRAHVTGAAPGARAADKSAAEKSKAQA
ncbi:MAG: preprotein translocase subunit YajC [Polyangia bacterium]